MKYRRAMMINRERPSFAYVVLMRVFGLSPIFELVKLEADPVRICNTHAEAVCTSKVAAAAPLPIEV